MKRVSKLVAQTVLTVTNLTACLGVNHQILTLEQKKAPVQEREWVYCTETDRVNDKKTYLQYDDELCLKRKIKIGNFLLTTKSTILNMNAEGADEIGYNELIISKNRKVIKKIKLEKDGEPFYFTAAFAKLRKGRYKIDLNQDGIVEFALVNYGTDQNRFTLAKIFSLLKDGSLKLYGTGTFNKDQGKHVMFGCPDCHTINLEACNTCY